MGKKFTVNNKEISLKLYEYYLNLEKHQKSDIQLFVNKIFSIMEKDIFLNSITIHNFFTLEIKQKKTYAVKFEVKYTISKNFKTIIKQNNFSLNHYEEIIMFNSSQKIFEKYASYNTMILKYLDPSFHNSSPTFIKEFFYNFIKEYFSILKKILLKGYVFKTNFGSFFLKHNKKFGFYLSYESNNFFQEKIDNYFSNLLNTLK